MKKLGFLLIMLCLTMLTVGCDGGAGGGDGGGDAPKVIEGGGEGSDHADHDEDDHDHDEDGEDANGDG